MAINPKKEQVIEKLVAASQAGDSEAFGKLYDLFVKPIYRYLYYRVGQTEAEDLTELVFLKTWEHIKKYKHGKSNFTAWIFRIAHNIAIDFYRSKSGFLELKEEIIDSRIESDASHKIRRRFTKDLLNRALGQVKDHYKQILVLKYMNDLSNEEIGKILGKNQTSLRILQFRALRSLKKVLESMGIHEF